MKAILFLCLLTIVMVGGCDSASDNTTDNTTNNSSGSRIGNKSTKVFHTSSCRYVDQITNKIYFSSREEALDSGYSPDQSNACKP